MTIDYELPFRWADSQSSQAETCLNVFQSLATIDGVDVGGILDLRVSGNRRQREDGGTTHTTTLTARTS